MAVPRNCPDRGTYYHDHRRDRDGTTVGYRSPIPTTAEDDDPKFMQAMDFGGGRTMHVRTMEANADGEVVEEVVVVSTDIDAPKATAFAMVDGQTLDVSTNTDERCATVRLTRLKLSRSLTDVLELIMSDAFTAGTAAELTFDRQRRGHPRHDEAFEAAGTYNGAMGTLQVQWHADCTVTLDAMGAITAMSDGWIFTPDAGATSDVADADYLNYGFWLKRTTDEDGVLTYNEVETFAGSSIEFRPGANSICRGQRELR